MKYKVGDKVRVRDWVDMEKEFGLIHLSQETISTPYIVFTKVMKRFCGNVITITKVNGQYYTVNECGFSFTDDMLSGLVEAAPEKAVMLVEKDHKVAIVRMGAKDYLFLVPKEAEVKAGQDVLCNTRRGQNNGKTVTASFPVGVEAYEALMKYFGTTEKNMKYIIATVEYKYFGAKMDLVEKL